MPTTEQLSEWNELAERAANAVDSAGPDDLDALEIAQGDIHELRDKLREAWLDAIRAEVR